MKLVYWFISLLVYWFISLLVYWFIGQHLKIKSADSLPFIKFLFINIFSSFTFTPVQYLRYNYLIDTTCEIYKTKASHEYFRITKP